MRATGYQVFYLLLAFVLIAFCTAGLTASGTAGLTSSGTAGSAVFCTVAARQAPLAPVTASVAVPIILDHNRIIVEGEVRGPNGQAQKVRLWVDSGNPAFTLSQKLARDLGLAAPPDGKASLDLAVPPELWLGNSQLDLSGVPAKVLAQPFWLFSATGAEANLPSTLLRKYHVIIDYPNRLLTLAKPGLLQPQGTPSPAKVHPVTGIVQIDGRIEGRTCSFAMDVGASYSFVSDELLGALQQARLARHDTIPVITGTAGCANMWGYFPPNEETYQIMRVPELVWGATQLKSIGMVAVPPFSADGPTWGQWYSKKTHHPVDGILGGNALKAYRIEIDYASELVYLTRAAAIDTTDLDIVGLSLRQLADGSYQIVGVTRRNGRPSVEGAEPGDLLVAIGALKVKGNTMGKVVDALRGTPGESRSLTLDRSGRIMTVEAKVEHLL